MNERILELARQANVLESQHYDNELEIQKFAELIVRECARVAEKAVHNDNEFRCMYDILTEHFGVKE